MPANPRSRVILASLIGTTIEFYDFYVYATAAVLVFPHLFFPAGNETTALLASFAVFGAAMVARPLGAIFFGHLGDKRGRKITLVGALLTMGIATFLIGLLPTYATVGWFAPALLVMLRLAQGFALGGEWSGAALVATENAPAGQARDLRHLPAARRADRLHHRQRAVPDHRRRPALRRSVAAVARPSSTWGWRIPFLFSVVMVAVGLWVRLNLVESTAFEKTVKTGQVQKVPLAAAFQTHWKELDPRHLLHAGDLRAVLPDDDVLAELRPRRDRRRRCPVSATTTRTFVLMMIVGVVFFGIFTMVSGPWADRWGRRKTLIWVTLGHHRLRPGLGADARRRHCRRHGLADPRLHA